MTASNQKWPRVLQMSWPEIRTRTLQSIHKRLDVAKYRVGLSAISKSGNPTPRTGRNFFFSTDEVKARADLVREYLPDTVRELQLEAEEICQHRFRLLDHARLDYG